MYTEGETNKEAFTAEIKRLTREGKISAEDEKCLIAFINKTNYNPITVGKQLMILGFAHIVDEINFSVPQIELIKTCEGFRKFLLNLPQHLRETTLAYS